MKPSMDEVPKVGTVSVYNDLQMRFDVNITRYWIRDKPFVQMAHDTEAKRITFTPTKTKLPYARRVSNRMIGAKRVIREMQASGAHEDRITAVLEDPSTGRFHIDYGKKDQ